MEGIFSWLFSPPAVAKYIVIDPEALCDVTAMRGEWQNCPRDSRAPRLGVKSQHPHWRSMLKGCPWALGHRADQGDRHRPGQAWGLVFVYIFHFPNDFLE